MLSKKRRTLVFIEAGILTLLVYLFSIMANSYLDSERFSDINQKLLSSSIEFDSSYAQNNFYSTFEISNCEKRKTNIRTQFQNLKKLGVDITNYGQLYLERNKEYSKLKKRTYFLDQLKLYADVLDYNNHCDVKILPIIYFYNGLSTQIDKQSIILEQFSINHKNETIIFSFDIFSEDEPILNNFKKNFNITFAPFVIINQKTTKNFDTSENVISLNSLEIEFKYFTKELIKKPETDTKTEIEDIELLKLTNSSVKPNSQIQNTTNDYEVIKE